MATKARKEREKPAFEVMKAADVTEREIRFPAIASPKIDGFRGYVQHGKLTMRSGKPCANRATQEFFSHPALEGFDGELVVGSPVSKDGFHATSSGLRTENFDPRATFLVFDIIEATLPFSGRLEALQVKMQGLPAEYRERVVMVQQSTVQNVTDLLKFEDVCIDLGFEGVIVRKPSGRYKNGRSTVEEQGMLKLKRFVDAEAVIVGMEQELDKHGRRKESMGALVVRDLKSGTEFNVGTGFTWKVRSEFWQLGSRANGVFIKYKYFPRGTKDKPRHPVFVGVRPHEDMDTNDVRRGRALSK